jgi:hypothetical protein
VAFESAAVRRNVPQSVKLTTIKDPLTNFTKRRPADRNVLRRRELRGDSGEHTFGFRVGVERADRTELAANTDACQVPTVSRRD